MAQLLPMSDEMIRPLSGRAAWMARQAMRGLIQSGFAARGALVPGRARVVLLVIHRGKLLRPGRLALRDPSSRRASRSASPGGGGEPREDALGGLSRVTDDADADLSFVSPMRSGFDVRPG